MTAARGLILVFTLCLLRSYAQEPITNPASDAPLPNLRQLFLDVESNQKRFEAAQNEYTYHVHVETQHLDGHGRVKEDIVKDYESLAIDGVRVNRLVARDDKPLSDDEARKESERIDKIVAQAKAERAKREARGQDTNGNGDALISASRILELGTFSDARRETIDGRPTIVADYNGDPRAKTRNAAEGVIRVLAGTVWIDEQDRALVRGEGEFRDDYKVLGGLVLDVHKGLRFQFRSAHVNDEVWLPASIDGQGSARALLFDKIDGNTHFLVSDYRKFRVKTTILPGATPVDPEGPHGAEPASSPLQPGHPLERSPHLGETTKLEPRK